MSAAHPPTADIAADLAPLVGKPVVIAIEERDAPFVFATGDIDLVLRRLVEQRQRVVIEIERPEVPFVFLAGSRLSRSGTTYSTELRDGSVIVFRAEHVVRIEQPSNPRPGDHYCLVLRTHTKGRKAA
jgi:hypothetical protein